MDTESRLMGQRQTEWKTVTGSLDTENYSHIEFIFIKMFIASATNLLTPLINGADKILHYVLVYEIIELSALFGKCITELTGKLNGKKESTSF